MNTLRFTLLLLAGFISSYCGAQSLGWGNTTFSKDTLQLGDTLFINTYLKNYDSVAFSDTVSFGLKINGVVNVNQNLFPNPFVNQGINIPVGDSIPASLFVVITPAYFAVGPDILVVWPKADNGATAHDTIVKTIIVVESTGLQDEDEGKLKIFYDGGQLHFNLKPEIELNRVRIFDLQGREILQQNDAAPIPFSAYPPGIYFADLNYNQNKRRILKFVVF